MDDVIGELETSTPAPAPAAPAPSMPAPRAHAPASAEVLSPEPRAIVLERERETLNAEIDRLREQTPPPSWETMKPYYDRDLELKGLLAAARATGEEGPKLSADPREAAAGLTAPEPHDPEALVQRFQMAGETLTPEGEAIARTISTVFPPEMLPEQEFLMKDVWAMREDAALHALSETDAYLAVSGQDHALYRILVDHLPPQSQAYLQTLQVERHPPAVQRIARAAERWLQTDVGTRWLSTGNGWRIRQQYEELEKETRREILGLDA